MIKLGSVTLAVRAERLTVAARLRDVEDANGLVVAAVDLGAGGVEGDAVGRHHLVHLVVGSVGGDELAAVGVPEMDRVVATRAQQSVPERN